LKIKDDDKSRIIFTAYPSLFSLDTHGGLCPSGRASMTVSEVFQVQDAAIIKKADDFEERRFIPQLKRYTQPWTYIDDHRPAFVGHGYCAQGDDTPNESGKKLLIFSRCRICL
jgi:hypothetical protein